MALQGDPESLKALIREKKKISSWKIKCMKVLNGARTQDSRNRRQQKVKWGSRKSTHARTGLSTNEQLSSALCMPRFAVTFVSSLLLLPIRVRAFFLINESRTYCMDFIIASRRSLFCHISLSNLFSTY